MATYPPPSETLPIFDSGVFTTNDTTLTISQADARYLKFPTGQGTETIPSLVVSGSATIDSIAVPNQIGFTYSIFPTFSSTANGYAISSPTFDTTTTFTAGVEATCATMSMPIGVWIVYSQIVVVTAQSFTSETYCLATLTAGTQRNAGNYHITRSSRPIVYGVTSFVIAITTAGTLTFAIAPNTNTKISSAYAYAVRIA